MALTIPQRLLVSLVFAAGAGLAHAGTTVYNFNFSVGGTGSLTYNDSTGVPTQ